MDTIYVYREKIQELYARHSRIINKAGQFILALAAFALINHNVGFMDALASPVAALGLAIICTGADPGPYVCRISGNSDSNSAGISGTVYLLSQAHAEDGASGPADPAGIFSEDPLCDPGCLRPGAFSGQRDRHDLRNDRILPAGICVGKCFLAGRERRSDDTDPRLPQAGVPE